MDEHAKTEQGLSEELLQQITGGCGRCSFDKSQITLFTERANLHLQLSQIAQDMNLHDMAREYSANAHTYSANAQQAQNKLNARQETPTHKPAPGESSSSEPPNKRQRII
jgi:hypothetical protein